jgi:molybdenum cofactor cytidylyltransferase
MQSAPSKNIGIVILAAGSSSRMGQSKQLLKVEGESLIIKAVKSAMESKTARTVVVLGANSDAHREVIKDLGTDIIENPLWKNGMGSSLKLGLRYLLATEHDLKAVIIMVCDQPEVVSKHLNDLIDAHISSGKHIVASFYDGSPGVPALIGNIFFDELLALDDFHGAKKIIQNNETETHLIPFAQGAIDLDTLEDYERYKNEK